MIRRYIGFLVLSALVAVHAAPLAAGVTHCAMQSQASPMLCCGPAGDSPRGASVATGSCCRFEAATPSAQAPGIIPTPSGSHDQGGPLAILSYSSGIGPPAPGRSGSEPSQPRSTDSPISLRNTLRL